MSTPNSSLADENPSWFPKAFMAAISVLALLVLSRLTIYEAISVGLFIYFGLKFIEDFGKSIWIIIDIIPLMAIIMWLITPIFFYHFYNEKNYLAVLWVRVMPVPSNTYYSFVLPGVMFLIAGLSGSQNLKKQNNENYVTIIRNQLKNIDPKYGYYLISISLFAHLLEAEMPPFMNYIIYLGKKLALIGLFYLAFSGSKIKIIYPILGFGILLIGSIRSAMFGETVFITFLTAIILSLRFDISIIKKIIFIMISSMAILIMQNVKYDYRQHTRKAGISSDIFINLVINRSLNFKSVFNPDLLFFSAVRLNQGWLIASTMERVPKIVPYANGETIFLSLAGSVIPRAIWPNKPKSGGEYNLSRFLGYEKLSYSMNISPIGEAYANFGPFFGIIYMYFYGLFFRKAYEAILSFGYRYPLIVLWIPIIMLSSISVETDTLSTVNSLIKSSFFIFILNYVWPELFSPPCLTAPNS